MPTIGHAAHSTTQLRTLHSLAYPPSTYNNELVGEGLRGRLSLVVAKEVCARTGELRALLRSHLGAHLVRPVEFGREVQLVPVPAGPTVSAKRFSGWVEGGGRRSK